jgi:HK97 family phage major capsid protein
MGEPQVKHVTQLIEERDSITSEVKALTERAAAEQSDLTPEQLSYIGTLQERAGKIDAQLVEHSKILDSQRSYADLLTKLEPREDQAKPERRNGVQNVETRSWGDLFVESDAFKNYRGAGRSQPATVPGLFESRAAITTGDGLVVPYVFSPVAYTYATPLMSVVGHITTGSNAVEYVRWTPNPQGAATIVPEGQPKPEAVMNATPTSKTLDTYAHWKGITRQALEDIPQIRSIIENRLKQGIMVALENAVAAALAADAAIPPATAPVGGSLTEAIRVGIATVQSAGFATPNAALVNPQDAAGIDIAMMAGTLNGASLNGTLWGIKVIPVPGLAAGTAYVGDFSAGVQIFDRGTTSLYMTDSHGDMFISNIVLLLAEIRALVAVTEPAAIAECSVAAGP